MTPPPSLPVLIAAASSTNCMLMPELTDQHNVNKGASHQCGPGSNPGIKAISGLSLLLVFSLAPRGFFPGTLLSPLLKTNTSKFKFDLERTDTFKRVHKNFKCFTGKQITIFKIFLNRRNTIVVSSVTLLPVLSTIICRSSSLK